MNASQGSRAGVRWVILVEESKKRGAGSTQQQRTEGWTGERRMKGEELCSKLKKRLSAVGWSVLCCCSQSHSSVVLAVSGAYRSVSALRWWRHLVIRSYQGISCLLSSKKLGHFTDFSCVKACTCVRERDSKISVSLDESTARTHTHTKKPLNKEYKAHDALDFVKSKYLTSNSSH